MGGNVRNTTASCACGVGLCAIPTMRVKYASLIPQAAGAGSDDPLLQRVEIIYHMLGQVGCAGGRGSGTGQGGISGGVPESGEDCFYHMNGKEIM